MVVFLTLKYLKSNKQFITLCWGVTKQMSTEAQGPCLLVQLEWVHQQDPVTEAAPDVRNVTEAQFSWQHRREHFSLKFQGLENGIWSQRHDVGKILFNSPVEWVTMYWSHPTIRGTSPFRKRTNQALLWKNIITILAVFGSRTYISCNMSVMLLIYPCLYFYKIVLGFFNIWPCLKKKKRKFFT